MTEGEPGQDPDGRQDVRLRALDERLRSAHHAEVARTGAAHSKPGTGYSQGSRVLAELIAGPAGGALIGWLLDRWFGTSPWILLALMFLGTVAAFWNIIRISGEKPE